jgi:colicin import membrane protein
MKHTKPGENRVAGTIPSEGGPSFPMAVLLSLIGHLSIFLIFIAIPFLPFHRAVAPRIISVDLVSMPVKAVARARPPSVVHEKRVTSKPPPKRAKEKALVKAPPPPKIPARKAISLAHPKTLPVRSMKERTFKATRVVESAIRRIEHESRHAQPNPIDKAIEKIRSEVQKEEAAGRSDAVTEQGKERAQKAEDRYRVEIADEIQRNWAYSEQMAGDPKKLSAWVVLKVAANGKILDFWFEKRSGNAMLDESVARAIQKSNPLPPFPQGVTDSSIHLGLRFSPGGIQ